MGYNITMSGSGLRFFQDYQRQKDKRFTLQGWLRGLLYTNLPYEVHCSRIDIAMDDVLATKGGGEVSLELDRVVTYALAGQFKTRAKSMGVMQSDSYRVRKDSNTGFSKPEPTGKTIYFGSRQSEKYVRVYDKLAEQKIKYPKDQALQSMSHWVRCEVEYKGDTAQEILKMYCLPEWEENYSAHLADLLRFVEPDGGTCKWWTAFCNHMGSVHLYVQRKRVDTGDFNKMRNTFFFQMGRNALTVMLGLGPDEFYNQLLSEEARLKKRNWSILHGYYQDMDFDKQGYSLPDAFMYEQLPLC